MDNTDVFDTLITLALKDITREDWEQIVSDPGVRPASPRFKRRMERIILKRRGESGRRSVFKKIGIGLLAALFAAAMLGAAVRPAREAVIRFVTTWYDTHFGVRYEVETDEPIPTVIEEVVLPAWLPEGWTLVTKFSSMGMVRHDLSDENGNGIVLEQIVLTPDQEASWFDNTDVEIETVLLNGSTEAQLFSYDDGGRVLTWADRYEFILTGYVDAGGDGGVLIRIAESMKQKGKS